MWVFPMRESKEVCSNVREFNYQKIFLYIEMKCIPPVIKSTLWFQLCTWRLSHASLYFFFPHENLSNNWRLSYIPFKSFRLLLFAPILSHIASFQQLPLLWSLFSVCQRPWNVWHPQLKTISQNLGMCGKELLSPFEKNKTQKTTLSNKNGDLQPLLKIHNDALINMFS